MEWRIAAVDGWLKAVDKQRENRQKSVHNVGQRTSTLCCHGSPLMARSFSNTDAFHRFNSVRDGDVFSCVTSQSILTTSHHMIFSIITAVGGASSVRGCVITSGWFSYNLHIIKHYICTCTRINLH